MLRGLLQKSAYTFAEPMYAPFTVHLNGPRFAKVKICNNSN